MNNGEPHRTRSRKARKNALYKGTLIGLIRELILVHISPDSIMCSISYRRELAVKVYDILMFDTFNDIALLDLSKYSGKIKNEIERLLNLQSFFVRSEDEVDYRKEYNKHYYGGLKRRLH